MPGTTVLNHNARPAQISPALCSPAAQRSAVRCRAVRCRALPYAAVLCLAALCFLSNIHQYQVNVLCTLRFAFFHFFISLGPHVFSLHANHTRTADQNVTPPTSTQHSTGQFGLHKQLLALQFAVRTKSWPPLSTPFTGFIGILPCANVAGGVSRPRGGALAPFTQQRRDSTRTIQVNEDLSQLL